MSAPAAPEGVISLALRLERLYRDGQLELARYRVPASDGAGGWEVDPEQYLEHDTAETDAALDFYAEAPHLITQLVTALGGPMAISDGADA